MENYLVLAENDESKWNDKTGEYYHFPTKYKNILVSGCKIIYYKGKKKDKAFERLSEEPHYFGIGTIGTITKEVNSEKKTTYYATITNYIPFVEATPFKDIDGLYLEPVDGKKNYFRDGVRIINKEIYEKILEKSKLLNINENFRNEIENSKLDSFLTSYGIEGGEKVIYTSRYERDPKLRAAAINIHGTTCKCCNFNFEKSYGLLGKNYIHVHHIKPISETGETLIDPEKDLIVLCPNCHSMIHRKRNSTLSLNELKERLFYSIKYIN